MCFSAQSSYTVGILTPRNANKPSQTLLTTVPFLFSIQRFIEGTLMDYHEIRGIGTTPGCGGLDLLMRRSGYLAIMILLSMWLVEKMKKRRQIMSGLMATGSLLLLYYVVCLGDYKVNPQVQSFHIQYIDQFPAAFSKIGFVVYLITVVTPLFVSAVKSMWLFGILIVLSCLVTGKLFAQYPTPVWCFLVALISVVIYWVVSEPSSQAIGFSKVYSHDRRGLQAENACRK